MTPTSFVAQHLVGLLYFLEFFLISTAIWMVFEG
jgi:hypothetical protein